MHRSCEPIEDLRNHGLECKNRKHIRTCGVLAAVTLSSTAFAATHIVDIAWPPDDRFAHKAQIEAGKFVEVCGKLAVGTGVRWSFTTGAPVDFNIHDYVGKEAVFPSKQAQVALVRDTLSVIVGQDYCWMWTNKGRGPVSLTVDLTRLPRFAAAGVVDQIARRRARPGCRPTVLPSA